MPDYLVQLKYESKAFENLIANPHSREEAIRPEIEKLGGKIKGLWFSFGRYDVVTILTLPDNVSMEAVAMSVKATGYIKVFNVVPLLSIDESIESMKKASTVGIKSPGK